MDDRSILIVDDEIELAEELGEFFVSMGWQAKVCFTAPAAMAALEDGLAPSCLLTDLRIADHDGAELVARVRKMPKHLQPKVVAIITGHVVSETEAADFHADFLFVKPVDPVIVMEGVERLLSGAPAPDREAMLRG
ncbi:response regulator [Azorhizobium doebereinerae]|uniref:response regulator n=1 Tax=Azorhizobium doebereinerae TaxID=281091 RepID=UPI0003FD36A9|nr:response regulator [Azorhizobium doebereinerae]